ncbi:putative ribonuclease M [[Candida] jaroonii]|uniref:Ribonuclease M n=1 Tax=[Candida] jaroonii TaxID=467808 RepID=A0ACA9YFD7_9ASCO|nr:putative ribonuclease M [[Candida] jaroonii]
MLPLITLLTIVSSASARFIDITARDGYPVESCDTSSLPFTCGSSSSSNTCCFEKDGLMLQTQFWDYDTSVTKRSLEEREVLERQTREVHGEIGVSKRAGTPSSSMDTDKVFTIHGLWSDKCDGSYDQYCQSNLEIPDGYNVKNLISSTFNKPDLYDLMDTYWLSNSGSNEELWSHEYNKHGTCMNTISPGCFTDSYQKYESPVLFWQKVTEIWDGLNTYDFLASAGITPSATKQYSFSDIQDALSSGHDGKEVHVGCDSDGAIKEIWYFYLLQGSVFTGNYQAVDSSTANKCPDQVWYYPK